MANYCWSKILASASKSEWKEISCAFNDGRIDWAIGTGGPDCDDWSQEISCENKWSPKPWNEGHMAALSRSYPSVMIHYTATYEGGERPDSAWFCNGDETNKKGAESSKKQAYKDAARRFLSANDIAAEGIEHRVEVMPDGRVAADGENRFGECNIYSWKNIKSVSCGNWHTVGLTEAGELVACGSNANGQCNVSGLGEKAVSVSCGRYHTAILLSSGRVLIKGNLEQEATVNVKQEEKPLAPSDFPMIVDLRLDKYINGWEKMNERIEHISVGDELTLKKVTQDGEISFEVLNMRGEKIGMLWTESNKSLAKMMKNIKVTVNTVTPLSQRRKGSKYAAMSIKLELIPAEGGGKMAVKPSSGIGDYVQTSIANWPKVVRIKSIYDAVIGVTAGGEIFIDGYCPCSEQDIYKALNL